MRQQLTSHHLVPPASIVALNSLVAEFLYTQNCQFTLSVFATEAPFPNALPDVYADTNVRSFRFNLTQQQDLLRSLGVKRNIQTEVQQNYSDPAIDSGNTSLLFTLLQTVFPTIEPDEAAHLPIISKSIQCNRIRKSQQTSSRHTKCMRKIRSHLNQLIDNIVQIKDSVETQSTYKHHDMSKLDRQRKRIRKLAFKHRHLQQIVESTCRLSTEIHDLVQQLNAKHIGISNQEQLINDADKPTDDAANANMKYNDWVMDMKNSANGKRFLQQIVKHYKRERQLEIEMHRNKLLDEVKLERIRLKRLYRERFLNRCRGLMIVSSENADDPVASGRLGNEQRNIAANDSVSERIVTSRNPLRYYHKHQIG